MNLMAKVFKVTTFRGDTIPQTTHKVVSTRDSCIMLANVMDLLRLIRTVGFFLYTKSFI